MTPDTEAELRRLREENAELWDRLFRAWAVLADWNGYWNPQTGTGDIHGLANTITSALDVLNDRKEHGDE